MRAVDAIIQNFNKYLLEPLNADLFIVAQKTNTLIDNNIHKFDTSSKIIYKNPPHITKLYKNYNQLKKSFNYLNTTHLNIYYNFYKINKIYGDLFEKNYQYIILTRSDFLHLFPFPDICNLYNKSNDIFWCYNDHEYGGINATLICVPSKYIKLYLSSCYNYLQNRKNINLLNNKKLNVERFFGLIFNTYKWINYKIQPNSFITASSFNEITTWGKIKYCNVKNVFYKYIKQKNAAFNALNKYNIYKKWDFYDNCISVNSKLLNNTHITQQIITPSVKENETNSFSFTDKSPTERNLGGALRPNFLSGRCNINKLKRKQERRLAKTWRFK